METSASTNSDEFRSLVKWSGHLITNCVCGRTHVATENEEWNQKELDNVKSVAEKNPNKYILADTDYIHSGEFGTSSGICFVENCPCMQGLELEKFIWISRKEIMLYYKNIQAKMERENISMKKVIQSIDSHLLGSE